MPENNTNGTAKASKLLLEWGWKITTAILLPLVVALVVWVWNTHATNVLLEARVVVLEEDVADLQVEMKASQENWMVVSGMQSDISWMRDSLVRIENSIPRSTYAPSPPPP